VTTRPPNDPRQAARVLHSLASMRCEFKSDGDTTCAHCAKDIRQGVNIYWISASYEYPNEGDYLCRTCAERVIDEGRCKRCLCAANQCAACERQEAEDLAYWERVATTREGL
jgi:hypothetical protein